MASLTKASHEALRSFLPWFSSHKTHEKDHGDRRPSQDSQSSKSTVPTSLGTSDSSQGGGGVDQDEELKRKKRQGDGWSSTLRVVASVFYVDPEEVMIDQNTPLSSSRPQTPSRQLARSPRKSLTWSRSSLEMSRSFKSVRSSMSVRRGKASPVTPSRIVQKEAPTLDVAIPDNSFCERSGFDLAAGVCGLNDPPTLFLAPSLEKIVENHCRGKQASSSQKSSLPAALALEDPYVDDAPKSQQDTIKSGISWTYTPRPIDFPGEDNEGYVTDVESNTQDHQSKESSGSTSFMIGYPEQFSQLSPCKSLGKQKSSSPEPLDLGKNKRLPARFPLRKRLSMKKSLSRLHTVIASSLSTSKAGINHSPSGEHDDSTDISDLSPLAPSMGSREQLIQARQERDKKYTHAMMDTTSTESDDESKQGLELARASCAKSQQPAEPGHLDQAEVLVNRPFFTGDLRYAVEAIERANADEMESVDTFRDSFDTIKEFDANMKIIQPSVPSPAPAPLMLSTRDLPVSSPPDYSPCADGRCYSEVLVSPNASDKTWWPGNEISQAQLLDDTNENLERQSEVGSPSSEAAESTGTSGKGDVYDESTEDEKRLFELLSYSYSNYILGRAGSNLGSFADFQNRKTGDSDPALGSEPSEAKAATVSGVPPMGVDEPALKIASKASHQGSEISEDD
ncbi:uncharacterized protein KY384_005509 [Bacidia gigantensis]|uniref:uncharacterized protein n=1 Tax=Bacidia gigantensis TaxID=2732470 RepID=UPI001D04DD77|nr:uncharacterized protein KY384_005509 [Bacidia gigantensis]KAG8530027.1 hypothetical protein KY384_005509 [Bacidia gigantensis]